MRYAQEYKPASWLDDTQHHATIGDRNGLLLYICLIGILL